MYVFTAELELQGKETEEGSEEQVWSSLLRPVVARVVSFGLWCGGDSMLLRNTPDMLPRFFPNPLPPAGNKKKEKVHPAVAAAARRGKREEKPTKKEKHFSAVQWKITFDVIQPS